MKTLDDVIRGYRSATIDGRDLTRLAMFIPAERLPELDMELKPGVEHTPEDFTRENVLKQLKEDVAFGFKKALDQRALSAGLMHQVVGMWNWILEEGLQDFSDDKYAYYGLPLFRATAVKYGFPNPIGDDNGDEDKYREQW